MTEGGRERTCPWLASEASRDETRSIRPSRPREAASVASAWSEFAFVPCLPPSAMPFRLFTRRLCPAKRWTDSWQDGLLARTRSRREEDDLVSRGARGGRPLLSSHIFLFENKNFLSSFPRPFSPHGSTASKSMLCRKLSQATTSTDHINFTSRLKNLINF